MYTNFIEARRFFAHWRVRDFLQAINQVTLDQANYPYQDATWEVGFFKNILNNDMANSTLMNALNTANLTADEVEDSIIPRILDKYISMDIATRITKKFGYIENTGLKEFDPCNPLDGVTINMGWYLRKEILTEINNRFGSSLLSMAKAYFQSEYNPIENYSMEQVETPDITHTKSGTSSETETPNITETIHTEANSKLQTDGASSGNVYGFGSSASTPLNEGESSQTTQGSKDDNYTDSERKEIGTRSFSGSSGETDKETGTRRLTRSGNIGVTTSQQMLQSEIELRKFDFLEEVFKCFDKVICASVY